MACAGGGGWARVTARRSAGAGEVVEEAVGGGAVAGVGGAARAGGDKGQGGGVTTGGAAPSRDAARVVFGGEKTVVGMVPTLGSTGGGTAVKIRHAGVSIDAARQFSVCHVGTIGPISAATVGIGETTEIECVTPGHAPGASRVSLAMGKGLTGDLSFTFVNDDAYASEAETDIGNDHTLPIAPFSFSACDDGVPLPLIHISEPP